MPAKSPKSAKPTKSSKLSASEKSDLEQFCESLQLDEISFESWDASHTDLNLVVPLWISAHDALQGGDRVINFSRTITKTPGAASERLRASCTVTFPQAVKDGARITVAGLGDQTGDVAGDLIVLVRVK